eukprot:7698945-Pyramimonas_sp.AAC.1
MRHRRYCKTQKTRYVAAKIRYVTGNNQLPRDRIRRCVLNLTDTYRSLIGRSITHGHTDTWTHGHMDTWTHGHMDTSVGSSQPLIFTHDVRTRSVCRGGAKSKGGKASVDQATIDAEKLSMDVRNTP